jgi:radical SAM protein with 4Fe4S-binding SPASM domain
MRGVKLAMELSPSEITDVAPNVAGAIPLTAKKTYVMRGGATARALDTYHLIFAPTHACNLRCQHCYLPDHYGYVMPYDQMIGLIDQWEQIVLRDRGPLGGYFHLKGGEPLILPYLPKVLDHLAARRTLRFMMTTNGTLLRRSFLTSLIRLNEALDRDVIVIVSLDGSREEKHRMLRGPNNFAATERFARTLIGVGINVHFNYVVHSGNLDDVPTFVQFAETIGATQVNFLPMVPKGYGAEMGDAGRPDPEALHQRLRQLYLQGDENRRRLLAGNYAHIFDLERNGVQSSHECVAGYKGLFYVTPEGDVYSCPNLLAAKLRVGNFLERPLIEIHDKGLDLLYRSHLNSPDIDDRYLCRGERFAVPAVTRAVAPTARSLPILSNAKIGSESYPAPARQLQSILLNDGTAKQGVAEGMSYCFSRNF